MLEFLKRGQIMHLVVSKQKLNFHFSTEHTCPSFPVEVIFGNKSIFFQALKKKHFCHNSQILLGEIKK